MAATGLYGAGREKYLDVVRTLLSAEGIVTNPENDDGDTPLQLALRFANVSIFKALVEHGADIEAVDYTDGGTPLIAAAKAFRLEAVQALVEAGADIAATNKYGRTPLEEARRWHRKGYGSESPPESSEESLANGESVVTYLESVERSQRRMRKR